MMKDGLRNGLGTIYYPDGRIRYCGYFENSDWHGKGRATLLNGDQFEGDFHRSLLHNGVISKKFGQKEVQTFNAKKDLKEKLSIELQKPVLSR